jgi:hypothetical protein
MPNRKTARNIHTFTPKHNSRKPKFSAEVCDDTMTFQECEMAILRNAVDEMDIKRGEKTANSPEVIKIIEIVEEFLINKKLVCYGGTAINNILPKNAQFYNRNVEIPDYDFFSPNALEDAKELADIYYKRGYDEVEAKAGVHEGTYKVFVNFISVADITYLHPTLYSSLKRDAIKIGGIRYAPPDYLRMGMFLELSRPEGDVSRWEKVLKRLNLLNKYYPLRTHSKCATIHFHKVDSVGKPIPEKIYIITRDSLVEQGAVFFGGYAATLYSKYVHNASHTHSRTVPDFDVLSDNPERCASVLKDTLHENNIRNVKLIQHTPIGEVVPDHIEVTVSGKSIAFIYRPISCHGYNTVTIHNKEVNIATIDTMLSFYLAFLYADKSYYDKDRILCMSEFLFHAEQQNRLNQRGIFKRFATKCYGKQDTMADIRTRKTRLYAELSKNRKSAEYEKSFLKYEPAANKQLKRDTEDRKPIIEKTHIIEDNKAEPEDAATYETTVSTAEPTTMPNKRVTRKRFRKIQRKSYRKKEPILEPKPTDKDTDIQTTPPNTDQPAKARTKLFTRARDSTPDTSKGKFLF